ncbi:Cytochrome C' [Bradyrhizobium erythrophlei]|uniref:Cytochrome C n=2 Tax=Bradyrhizobium erythrophlei TaxID=1437360 RepID=A0A1H5GD93_9BRAD|nr:Cytochrome C' [Bradyrhizobium erythrophlei]
MTRRKTIARSCLITCCLVGLSAGAVVMAMVLRSSGAAGPHRAALVPVEYVPSISDLMIGTIQPRHERLWRAAMDSNWDFAVYELGNLHGAFARLGRAHPTEQNMSFPDMIAGVIDQPFKDLNSAIQTKDQAAFSNAYGELTDACNSCHQALNHGVVLIGTPDAKSGSDLILQK